MLLNEDVVMFMEAVSEPQRLDRDQNLFGAIPGTGDQWVADHNAAVNESSPVISLAPISEIVWPRVWPGL
jgi:hypothetical protein